MLTPSPRCLRALMHLHLNAAASDTRTARNPPVSPDLRDGTRQLLIRRARMMLDMARGYRTRITPQEAP